MSYMLSGFIAKCGIFDKYRHSHPRVSVATLTEEFDLLLNDEYLRQALGKSMSGDPEGFEHWLLSEEVITLVSELSMQTPVAYVLADFFGGIGSQSSAVWKKGKMTMKSQTCITRIPQSFGPVNAALKEMGVIATEGKDEFETIGLNRHRQMEDWFEASTGINSRKYYEEW